MIAPCVRLCLRCDPLPVMPGVEMPSSAAMAAPSVDPALATRFDQVHAFYAVAA
jgi:hypothetical protein